MKLINFKIKDSINFEINDKNLDIHNNYNCSGFCYNFEKRQIIVSWNVGTGDWIPEDTPSSLELIINDVSMLKTTERNSELPFSEDDCISSIGFVYFDTENDDMNAVIQDSQSEGFNLFGMWFQSGFCLYLNAKSAKLVI